MFLFVLFLFVQNSFATDCNHKCNCLNLTTYYEGKSSDIFYSEGPDCTFNITCQSTYNTWLTSTWNVTEIPKPDNIDPGDYVIFPTTLGYVIGPYVDLFELYGLICENGKWMITKYPFDVEWQDLNLGFHKINRSELEGKGYKSELNYFRCWSKLSED